MTLFYNFIVHIACIYRILYVLLHRKTKDHIT